MTSVRLPADLENRLNELSKRTHIPKSFYLREAFMQYIEAMEEEHTILERINTPNIKYSTSEEVSKRLGFDV